MRLKLKSEYAYSLFKRIAIATHAVGSAIDEKGKKKVYRGRPGTSFFFLSLVLLLGPIDSVGDCLFKFLGPEVVGKPWPAVPGGSFSCRNRSRLCCLSAKSALRFLALKVASWLWCLSAKMCPKRAAGFYPLKQPRGFAV